MNILFQTVIEHMLKPHHLQDNLKGMFDVERMSEMNAFKPDLVILPFVSLIQGTPIHLTFEQAIEMLRNGNGTQVHIERSYPGAPHAIGWTIFRRTVTNYLYENEPLFRFERSVRAYIRKAYAIRYSLHCDDCLTHSHLHL